MSRKQKSSRKKLTSEKVLLATVIIQLIQSLVDLIRKLLE